MKRGWTRIRHRASPFVDKKTVVPLIDRIDLDERTGCWNWRGAKSRGYGIAKWRGRLIHAHRLSAILWLGLKNNSPLLALHKCDNAACFNPKHIYLGTQSQNIRDCVARGRHVESRKTHCSMGHPFSQENTIVNKLRHRRCRTCHTAWLKAQKEQMKRDSIGSN